MEEEEEEETGPKMNTLSKDNNKDGCRFKRGVRRCTKKARDWRSCERRDRRRKKRAGRWPPGSGGTRRRRFNGINSEVDEDPDRRWKRHNNGRRGWNSYENGKVPGDE